MLLLLVGFVSISPSRWHRCLFDLRPHSKLFQRRRLRNFSVSTGFSNIRLRSIPSEGLHIPVMTTAYSADQILRSESLLTPTSWHFSTYESSSSILFSDLLFKRPRWIILRCSRIFRYCTILRLVRTVPIAVMAATLGKHLLSRL